MVVSCVSSYFGPLDHHFSDWRLQNQSSVSSQDFSLQVYFVVSPNEPSDHAIANAWLAWHFIFLVKLHLHVSSGCGRDYYRSGVAGTIRCSRSRSLLYIFFFEKWGNWFHITTSSHNSINSKKTDYHLEDMCLLLCICWFAYSNIASYEENGFDHFQNNRSLPTSCYCFIFDFIILLLCLFAVLPLSIKCSASTFSSFPPIWVNGIQ